MPGKGDRIPKRVRRPVRYQVFGCSKACSFNASHYSPEEYEQVHSMFEKQWSRPEIVAALAEMGYRRGEAAVGNHKSKHLHEVRGAAAVVGGRVEPPGKPMTELEILDALIQKGGRSVDVAGFNVTAEQMLKAIDLKLKLTQGSMFEDFFKGIGAVGDEMAAEGQPEAPDAVAGEEEQAQAAPDEG